MATEGIYYWTADADLHDPENKCAYSSSGSCDSFQYDVGLRPVIEISKSMIN